ncbi:uncharacterized protein LOC134693859 [Mytilus trossulus]|uniref:uncharacterized protein LOC134693859 n=1 Tax=Mytilus trossulus TaxID=6551 RepID=UPI0030061060
MSSENFDKIKKESSKKYKHADKRTFIKVGKSKYFLSRDMAGHGTSFCKLYEEKGSSLDFKGSVSKQIFKDEVVANESRLEDAFSKPDLKDFDIISKQESREDTVIKKKDLNG